MHVSLQGKHKARLQLSCVPWKLAKLRRRRRVSFGAHVALKRAVTSAVNAESATILPCR